MAGLALCDGVTKLIGDPTLPTSPAALKLSNALADYRDFAGRALPIAVKGRQRLADTRSRES